MIRSSVLLLALASGATAACDSSHGKGTAAVASGAVAAPPSATAGSSGAGPRTLESSLAGGTRSIGFAVYAPAPISGTVLKDTQEAAREQFPGVNVLFMPMEAPLPQALIFAPDIASFAPPTEQQLTMYGRGLDPTQRHAAAESKGVLVLGWKLDADPRLDRLRDAQRLALDVAQKTQGFVWDETTGQLFGLPAWKKTRLDSWDGIVPDMRQHIALHFTNHGAQHRVVSFGMVKFGLPDLVVADMAPGDVPRMTTLLGIVAQTLVEGESPGTSGELALDVRSLHHAVVRDVFIAAAAKDAPLRGRVGLVSTMEVPGDPQNRLFQVTFTTPGATLVDKASAGLTAILGAAPAP